MQTYLREKPVWLQLVIFGALTGGIMLAGIYVGFSIIASVNHMTMQQIIALGPAEFAKPENIGIIRGLMVLQFFVIFFLPPLVFAYLTDPHPLYYAGIRPAQKKSFFLLAVGIMIAAYFTVEFFGVINEWLVRLLPKNTQSWITGGEDEANGTLKNLLNMKGGRDLVKSILLLGVLPAVGEELFFRGILQKLFIQIFRKAWPGIIFTAFLFSAFHMQFMGFLPRMALGVILGALYWYSGSLLTSMAGHFTFNTINVLLIYFNISDIDAKTETSLVFILIGLVSLAIVIFLLNWLRNKSATSYYREFQNDSDSVLFEEPDDPA